MKPVYQKLIVSPDEGFACKIVRGSGFDCPWHFHEEYELILVRQSGGYRMVGDHLAPLRPGDLVLVGPNLPHLYQNHEHKPGGAPLVEALLIQFVAGCVGGLLERLPARTAVRRLLQRAVLGLQFVGSTRDKAGRLMEELMMLEGLPRVIRFLTLLETLACAREARDLASPGFMAQTGSLDQERMSRVTQFIHEHFDQPLSLGELARMNHLSRGGFSRFFHAHTGRTLPHFVNELRVGRACRLLAEGQMGITEVAFACGFSSLSNFNRQFRLLKQTTPKAFQQTVHSHVGSDLSPAPSGGVT